MLLLTTRNAASRRAGMRAVVALAVGVAVPAAIAGGPEQVKLTAAGQAAARAPLLKMGDLPGRGRGWTGGPTQPEPDSASCGSHADLVSNGSARAVYQAKGLQLESAVDVLATSRMVRRDWQRTVISPHYLTCIRAKAAQSSTASAKFISLESVPLPRSAGMHALLRLVTDRTTSNGVVRVMTDVYLVGKGRTELVLTSISRLDQVLIVFPLEQQLMAKLAARIRA